MKFVLLLSRSTRSFCLFINVLRLLIIALCCKEEKYVYILTLSQPQNFWRERAKTQTAQYMYCSQHCLYWIISYFQCQQTLAEMKKLFAKLMKARVIKKFWKIDLISFKLFLLWLNHPTFFIIFTWPKYLYLIFLLKFFSEILYNS